MTSLKYPTVFEPGAEYALMKRSLPPIYCNGKEVSSLELTWYFAFSAYSSFRFKCDKIPTDGSGDLLVEAQSRQIVCVGFPCIEEHR